MNISDQRKHKFKIHKLLDGNWHSSREIPVPGTSTCEYVFGEFESFTEAVFMTCKFLHEEIRL